MTKWNYLEPFLYTREYLHLRDISRKLKKPHASVRKYLNIFEKEGILNKEIKGRLTLYKINIEHPNIIEYLTIAEKEKLLKELRKNLILNELIKKIHETTTEDNKILIFGSAATEYKKANDIDILITGRSTLKIKEIENKLNIKIHLINTTNLNNITETLKKEIRKKHLIIEGSEEIIKWLI